jgi:putative transposase
MLSAEYARGRGKGGTVLGIQKAAPETERVSCKYCGNRRTVKYGHYRGSQRWWCKDCKKKFVANAALPGMKTPMEQVAFALREFYAGTRVNDIREKLRQTYGNYASDAAIYYWIKKFTSIAIKAVAGREYHTHISDTWIADETMLKILGQKLWFWEVLCARTRFLLAYHVSVTRTTRDAQRLVERASRKAGKIPKFFLTDNLAAYLDGIELAFGADTKHLTTRTLTPRMGEAFVGRFQGTLKNRTKLMRSMKKREAVKLVTDGWLVHYNFFRPHEDLDGKTPAQRAGISFPFKDWLEVVQHAGGITAP